ncbi:unnamed protein product [Somion occarium]|uniref:2-(3-amino-3-carboxypropyl)histidine synthase subunit 2 n=2 Tax=Somion occarium TaxID=3059160 RepID=A0ABP1D3X9_9APHY
MTEHTAFSSSGEDIIASTIDVAPDGPSYVRSEEDFLDYYDIERTVLEIQKGDYRRIALQFPDELLHDSMPIFRSLKRHLGEGKELYVLADTSYGSCCVDEVAAQHVDADAMVHYGHACMSQTSRLPVIYVFGKKEIDTDDCTAKLLAALKESSTQRQGIMLRFDVAYAHRADKIMSRLRNALEPTTRLLYTPSPTISSPTDQTEKSSQNISNGATPKEETLNSQTENEPDFNTVLYIGGESLTLTNLLMTHSSCEVYSYDPVSKTTRLESTRVNKLLMRRYATVQKARDADVFGILVGTLGVASYLPLISHLRSVLTKAHKKSYTISVGKLNPAKLANFLEIECFVLVACPENSVIEAKEFLRPIVTPYELDIALQSEPTWTGEYILDFKKILESEPKSLPEGENEEEPEDLDQPVFSLVTGKYRHAKRYGTQATAEHDQKESSSAIVLRNQDNAVTVMPDSAAGQFLQNRTFRGLETRIGEDAPSVLEQGRSGIARGYRDDHQS